jgi:hypothetical protein
MYATRSFMNRVTLPSGSYPADNRVNTLKTMLFVERLT